MDKGAHFYKCDFQVHNPRDLNWVGLEATSDSERKVYAEELILACRCKGLDAIAITDHHDSAFFPHVKEAARNELDDKGQPVPDNKRIVVFPGIELTLTAPACQALLILDAKFPENMLASVLTALSIYQAPPTHMKHAQVVRIPHTVVGDFSQLYDLLNSHTYLKGRFIVFPNVSETGHGTLLRSGFANFYKTMPCVGGYIDGAVSKFGTGNRSIVSGENRDYGFKAIGVIQTSDNRRRDHANLGKYVTWVKWSEPTAEALRQACLAKESRLSQAEPDLPVQWVVSMSVSNSSFLGRIEVEFNQQNNAVIGGRGTGKSTILEYLRWGLCDQPVDNSDSDFTSVQTRRKKLINDTLLKLDGEVIVTFLLNNVRHIVKRNAKTQEISLKISDGEFASVTEQQVRSILPIQAYSQKQLSSVGVRLEELKRFVELPIKQDLDKIRFDIRDVEAELRSAYSNVTRQRQIDSEIMRRDVEIMSQTEQLASLRGALKGLTDEDQKTIAQKAAYDNEETITERLAAELQRAKGAVEALQTGIGEGEAAELPPQIGNPELIRAIQRIYAAKFRAIREQIAQLAALFDEDALFGIEQVLSPWEEKKRAFDAEYEKSKSKASSNRQQLDQIQTIEKGIADQRRLQMASRGTVAEFSTTVRRVNADLLTLSACETGVVSSKSNGQEVDGLAMTAHKKGAKAVISSLWEVNDTSTGKLMADFYQRWVQGGGDVMKVEALRQAQLDLLTGKIKPDPDYSNSQAPTTFAHPYYWAPFVLTGNWR